MNNYADGIFEMPFQLPWNQIVHLLGAYVNQHLKLFNQHFLIQLIIHYGEFLSSLDGGGGGGGFVLFGNEPEARFHN